MAKIIITLEDRAIIKPGDLSPECSVSILREPSGVVTREMYESSPALQFLSTLLGILHEEMGVDISKLETGVH